MITVAKLREVCTSMYADFPCDSDNEAVGAIILTMCTGENDESDAQPYLDVIEVRALDSDDEERKAAYQRILEKVQEGDNHMTTENKKPLKGLPVDIYRPADRDCDFCNTTSRFNRAILVGEGVPELFEVREGQLALKLVKRTICGKEYKHVEPVERPAPGMRGYMFGGNFIHSSDSRFPNDYPIPIHDRVEAPL